MSELLHEIFMKHCFYEVPKFQNIASLQEKKKRKSKTTSQQRCFFFFKIRVALLDY